MTKAYLGLGSNMGNRRGYLTAALKVLRQHKDIQVTRTSSIYETEPGGPGRQRHYLNAVVEVETALEPAELLSVCRFIEQFMGRRRRARWGPRTIDVDILLYGERQVTTQELTIPHPQICKRAFVLQPLLEIAPQVRFPSGERLAEYLRVSSPRQVVRVGCFEPDKARRDRGQALFD